MLPKAVAAGELRAARLPEVPTLRKHMRQPHGTGAPPAGPQWRRGLAPLPAAALGYDKPLCASLAGFTLHAATRAGALDPAGREKLLRYVLRPPIAYERLERRPEGLVRIALKRAFADGTLADEMDPLSLLCRLATSVPPPRFHTVKYAGVLAPASAWRTRIRPQPEPIAQLAEPSDAEPSSHSTSGYRGWAELLKRTFDQDILECPSCRIFEYKCMCIVLKQTIDAMHASASARCCCAQGCEWRNPVDFWQAAWCARSASGGERQACTCYRRFEVPNADRNRY